VCASYACAATNCAAQCAGSLPQHPEQTIPASCLPNQNGRDFASGAFGQDSGNYNVHNADYGREQRYDDLENQRSAAGFLLDERHNRSHHDYDERYYQEYHSKSIDKLLHDSSHLLLKPVVSKLSFVPELQ
jgi:hypothetical protein